MINRLLLAAMAMLILAVSATEAIADDSPCDSCGPVCTSCDEKVCVTTAKPGKETKHCWDVECAEVCIPAVRFPWDCRKTDSCADACEPCLTPKCGRVRCVKRLKTVEYQCDVCEYEHTIACRPQPCEPINTEADACVPSRRWYSALVPQRSNVEAEELPSSPPQEETLPPVSDVAPRWRLFAPKTAE